MTTIESIREKLDKVGLFLFAERAGYNKMVKIGPYGAREAFKQLAFEVEPMIDTLNGVKAQLREEEIQSARVKVNLEYVINYLDQKITHLQESQTNVADDYLNGYIKHKRYLIDAIEEIDSL